MRSSITILSLALSVLPDARAQNLDANTIQSMGNNSLFTRWRPVSHFIAPAGWMNDPCGMLYDPTKDLYHVMYQWHPNHINWGNISWGHATSKDLVTWTDVRGWQDDQAQSLGTGPVGTYDGLGVFSGTAQPVNINGKQDGTLLIYYTSVSKLPTSWSLPYFNGTESQSLAVSKDGGETWEKYQSNPILSQPPEGWNITGWRDPFFEPWPEMDTILEQSEPHYYAVFGSGIKGVGPRMPFYSAPASDLTKWTFLGALWEPVKNTSLGSPLETGSYAFNFEVSGFFSLKDENEDTHYYVNMGSEGGNGTFHPSPHWALWNEGDVSRHANGSAQFNPIAGGAADWGLLYAVTSFNDTKKNRRVQWGWAPEEMGDLGLTQQGFQGAFALPRELFVKITKGVVATDGDLAKLGNSRYVKDSDGTYIAYTLGSRPLPEVVAGIRQGSTTSNVSFDDYGSSKKLAIGSSHMEIKATFCNFTGVAGLTIAASPQGEEYTNIFWDPATSTINVNRTFSSTIYQFSNYTVTGYFAPYRLDNGVEDVTMNVFLDGSLLEVYVNERFALTTRIYPSRTDSIGYGIYLADDASVHASQVESWIGTANIFPDRPTNSSSRLVFDTVQQTNNYTWWTGN